MAEENNEDDSWLYGSAENQDNQNEQRPEIDERIATETAEPNTAEPSGNDKYDPDEQQVSHSSANSLYRNRAVLFFSKSTNFHMPQFSGTGSGQCGQFC